MCRLTVYTLQGTQLCTCVKLGVPCQVLQPLTPCCVSDRSTGNLWCPDFSARVPLLFWDCPCSSCVKHCCCAGMPGDAPPFLQATYKDGLGDEVFGEGAELSPSFCLRSGGGSLGVYRVRAADAASQVWPAPVSRVEPQAAQVGGHQAVRVSALDWSPGCHCCSLHQPPCPCRSIHCSWHWHPGWCDVCSVDRACDACSCQGACAISLSRSTSPTRRTCHR